MRKQRRELVTRSKAHILRLELRLSALRADLLEMDDVGEVLRTAGRALRDDEILE